MTLQAVAGTPGLWRAGTADAAGLHALIIGISDYPYLSEGAADPRERAPDDGGLGQLEVSALSGALIFDWLRSVREVAGAPLASCRLHLAPRPDELGRVQTITGHYGKADYASLRAAIDGWCDEMSLGGRSCADPNVALFFFSGHGVEVAGSPAVLASNVLTQRTADRGASHAIAIEALCTAVKTYDIDRALFLVDSCRDAPTAARLLHLVGDQSRRPADYPTRRVDAFNRLQSTASGLKSYQVADGDGTLFTQAALDGLKGGPPPDYMPYDIRESPWPLRLAAFEEHVRNKVIAILSKYNPLPLQFVELYGSPYQGTMLVAVKDGPPPGGESDDRGPPVELRDLEEKARLRADKFMAGVTSIAAEAIADLRSNNHMGREAIDLTDTGVMHAIFRHEAITYPWIDNIRITDAETGDSSPYAVSIIGAHSEEIGDQVGAWIDLVVRPKAEGGALWIGLGQEGEGSGFAVTVPRDSWSAIPVRLDILYRNTGPGWAPTRLSARLADPGSFNSLFPEIWSDLFRAQRLEALSDLASAARAIWNLDRRDEILTGEGVPALAALIAQDYLLRAGGSALLLDSEAPARIGRDNPGLADASLLWGETLLQADEVLHFGEASIEPMIDGQPVSRIIDRFNEVVALSHDKSENIDVDALLTEMGELQAKIDMVDGWTVQAREAIRTNEREAAMHYFSDLSERGVPLLGSSLRFALRQADRWRIVDQSGLLFDESAYRLRAALEYVDRAGKYAISGTGFARYAALEAVFNPAEMLGIRRRPGEKERIYA